MEAHGSFAHLAEQVTQQQQGHAEQRERAERKALGGGGGLGGVSREGVGELILGEALVCGHLRCKADAREMHGRCTGDVGEAL